MNSLKSKRYPIFVSLFLMHMTLFGYAFETVEVESSGVRTHLFEIEKIDMQSAKESVEALLSKDENIRAHIELFTVDRPEGSFGFLAVQDTPLKIEEIGAVLKKLEETAVSQSTTVSMNFSDVPLNQILATIAQAYGLNVVGGEELSQKASIYLKDIPIEDVFEVVLKSSGYTYIKEGNIIWVVSKESIITPLVTEVLKLKFASAMKIQEAVGYLLSSGGSIKSFINFGEEKYANYLIITDTTEGLSNIKKVIKKLDRRIGQVVIEAKFAEVTLDKDDEVGVDLALQASVRGTNMPTTFPFNAQATKVFGQTMLNRPTGSIVTTPEFTFGQLTFQDATATIKALDSKSVINLIASPRLTTRDGEQAKIVIGDRIPIPIYERNESVGSIEITGYQDENVGTLLTVTPMINDDRTITLVVHPEVSEITGFTGPNKERPIVSTREITTTFTVENGKTVVIGGLKKKTINNTHRQIPIFGDMFGWIPVFGRLFRFQDDATDIKELLIFITPTIVEEEQADRSKTQEKGEEAT